MTVWDISHIKPELDDKEKIMQLANKYKLDLNT